MPERPPKQWLTKMKKQLKKQYKGRSDKELTRIAAGIWHNFAESTKRRLTARYERRKRQKR